MVIHCTRKLAAKLPVVSGDLLTVNSPLGSWHANLYTIDRRNCLLILLLIHRRFINKPL